MENNSISSSAKEAPHNKSLTPRIHQLEIELTESKTRNTDSILSSNIGQEALCIAMIKGIISMFMVIIMAVFVVILEIGISFAFILIVGSGFGPLLIPRRLIKKIYDVIASWCTA